ncbi:hypothetical protein HMPREF9581_00148 [Cutibacterium acnes HL087PA3]|nr:hypothetical protein HMPREF9614_00464 [Cutibacterium acnes HL002PA2]EFT08948.1 hypothetical protein HMPREF9618_00124 [Cutibacterium acnes HL082PA1]EFT28760.1 hypothetical protein HMPREF9594_01298 [Cutibacterium acnes HL005PA1]EGE95218.1 hypothetical protein HMPREF9570_00122 [Cutibacterium acnes HL043PA1]EGF02529.1 hypothetical protein HMPREF9581_00148 [Cutibacterium acnes HL087PA3]EGF04681.1 hypothetical protein HMPREF9586_00126 [Cutibacterium acnes HL083PA2]MCW5107352.1 hypothetical prote
MPVSPVFFSPIDVSSRAWSATDSPHGSSTWWIICGTREFTAVTVQERSRL